MTEGGREDVAEGDGDGQRSTASTSTGQEKTKACEGAVMEGGRKLVERLPRKSTARQAASIRGQIEKL